MFSFAKISILLVFDKHIVVFFDKKLYFVIIVMNCGRIVDKSQ